MKSDAIIRSANEYMFNVSVDRLVDLVAQFNIYLGSQNSIYHLSKGLGLDVIGILPENVPPDLVVLPMLTQMNYREIEMLDAKRSARPLRWKQWMEIQGRDPNESHHIGWLYPDSCHLTERKVGTNRCLPLSIENIDKALKKEMYPYGDERLWKVDKYSKLWIGDT